MKQIPVILQGAEMGLAMAPEPGQQILPDPMFTEQEDSAARHRGGREHRMHICTAPKAN